MNQAYGRTTVAPDHSVSSPHRRCVRPPRRSRRSAAVAHTGARSRKINRIRSRHPHWPPPPAWHGILRSTLKGDHLKKLGSRADVGLWPIAGLLHCNNSDNRTLGNRCRGVNPLPPNPQSFARPASGGRAVVNGAANATSGVSALRASIPVASNAECACGAHVICPSPSRLSRCSLGQRRKRRAPLRFAPIEEMG